MASRINDGTIAALLLQFLELTRPKARLDDAIDVQEPQRTPWCLADTGASACMNNCSAGVRIR